MRKPFFLMLLTLFVCLSALADARAQTRGWGLSSHGALGTGGSGIQSVPQTVAAVPEATGLAAGLDHSLFLRPDGTLLVAGSNDFGQFGAAEPEFSTTPVAVPLLTNVVQASSGVFHSVALLADGTVRAWGYNGEGQIGNNTTTTTGCTCVPEPTPATITNVVLIEAGSFHTLALKADGTVWAWGLNDNGQLGDGTETSRSAPVQVGAGVLGFNNIIAVSAGDNHSMALKADGSVWVWGGNEYGQIGNGAISSANQLTPVVNASLSNIAHIAAGVFHNLALTTSGKVFVWGDNLHGQVGNDAAGAPQTTPVQNTMLGTVIEIETAGFTNYARLPGGAVYAWGLNDVGQTGSGTTSPAGCQCVSAPVQTQVGAGNTGIAAGWYHAFSLKPVFDVPAGANQTFRGDNVRLTFADVAAAGSVSYTAVDPAALAGSYSVPLGYTIQVDQPAYDVSTTAAASGDIDVCLVGLNEFSQTAFANLRILHAEGAFWIDRTHSSNFQTRQICARVSGLSPFLIATPPGATAAQISVSGRVVSGKSGVARALVSMTDANGATRATRTNSMGFYRFEALSAGTTYTASVQAKGYSFVPQIVALNDSVDNLDFEVIE